MGSAFQFFRKLKLTENQLLLKLVLSLLLPSLAILIVISGFFSLTYSRESMQDIVSNSFMMLSNIIKPLNYMMESAKQITFEIYKSASIFPLISPNVTNEGKIKAATYLSNMLASNSNIYSIYIYKDGKTLLRFGGSTLFDESDSSVSGLIAGSAILHPIPRKITTNNGSLDLISIVYTDVNARKDNYYVVLNLQPNIINLSQNQKFLNAGQKLIVADSSGNVLAHTDSSMFASNLSAESYFRDSYSSKAKYGTLPVATGHGKGIAAYLGSDNGMYMAYFISDYDSFYAQTTKTSNTILAFCAAILVLLIASSVFISYKVYTPLNSIFSHIKGLINSKRPGEKNVGSDLRHAAIAIGRVIDRLNSLDQDENDSEKDMKNNFMFRLLSGRRGMTPNEFNQGVERFLPFSRVACGSYQAVVLRIDNYRNFIEANSIEAVNFQLSSIEGISEDLLGESMPCCAFANDTEQIVVLTGREGQVSELTNHSIELRKIMDTVRQLFNISLTIGISGQSDCLSIDSLKAMYEEAFTYTNYRVLNGRGAVYCRNNIKVMNGKCEKGREFAASVVSSAKNGTQEQFNRDVDQLFSFISSYSYENIIEVLFQVSDLLLKTIVELQPHSRRLDGLGIEQIKQSITELEDYSQIKLWFLDQYSRIHNLISALKNSKASDLHDEAVGYINAHYNDPNLSASLIAEKLGITPQYFSKLFKQMTAMSFPDYLSNIRLEHARKLLCANPLLSVCSICEKIGYNSASYFSTSFTRKYGIPPSKFVLLAKEQQ